MIITLTDKNSYCVNETQNLDYILTTTNETYVEIVVSNKTLN